MPLTAGLSSASGVLRSADPVVATFARRSPSWNYFFYLMEGRNEAERRCRRTVQPRLPVTAATILYQSRARTRRRTISAPMVSVLHCSRSRSMPRVSTDFGLVQAGKALSGARCTCRRWNAWASYRNAARRSSGGLLDDMSRPGAVHPCGCSRRGARRTASCFTRTR